MYGIHLGDVVFSYEKGKKTHQKTLIDLCIINYGDPDRNIKCEYLRMKIQREIGKETPYKVEKIMYRQKIGQTVWS